VERGEWLSPQAWRAERAVFMRELEAWRADWESRDPEKYLSRYAADFRVGATDLAAWSAHKRKLGAAGPRIKVVLGNVSVLRAGGREGVVEVTFDEDDRSSNLIQRARKRQYWVQENGRWKIAYEATLGARTLRLPESFKSAAKPKGARS